mgnify:CR=1 FL=1
MRCRFENGLHLLVAQRGSRDENTLEHIGGSSHRVEFFRELLRHPAADHAGDVSLHTIIAVPVVPTRQFAR